jgi:hypothetical protein
MRLFGKLNQSKHFVMYYPLVPDNLLQDAQSAT